MQNLLERNGRQATPKLSRCKAVDASERGGFAQRAAMALKLAAGAWLGGR
jgi:hypothetical protein